MGQPRGAPLIFAVRGQMYSFSPLPGAIIEMTLFENIETTSETKTKNLNTCTLFSAIDMSEHTCRPSEFCILTKKGKKREGISGVEQLFSFYAIVFQIDVLKYRCAKLCTCTIV